MARENVNDLLAFIAVARERSFTKAAAKMGVSQSALSHTLRQLEARLGVRLLTRTTRAVSATEAGQRLLDGISTHFDEIEAELDALSAWRERPAGSIRITASDHAITWILWPKLRTFLKDYPDIKVELIRDNGLTDIVTERFDAGVRMGEQLAKDMISARISPDFPFAVVGAPSYFAQNPPPLHPQDLVRHTCINERLPTFGGFWIWEFEKDGQETRIRVEGQLASNTCYQSILAAAEGFGLAFVPEDVAEPYLADGRLLRVLEDWTPPWDGYHLYYPSRRQSSPAFTALVNALRHRD
ncbi:DNA-binding transcriptional regulator, LysR family [Rhizobium sp. RU35A]|uniref:LysR family transcriptional regulator n=1 Tax=Rhizobium sp. RU35A TaxID=1907414 RepID=UPI00095477CB|nr:LysR family transcriptional regulator [Rhizobium sp. RU35A]SIQ46776.1 DNA-binding transcriptional regulator, LysR family [Rhizobium sp. RU35A]